MDENDDSVDHIVAIADHTVVRGQFRRAAHWSPVPQRVVSDDVNTESRACRPTSGLLRRVQFALAVSDVGPASSAEGVRMSVGVSAAGVVVRRRMSGWRTSCAHLAPSLRARVHDTQHASRTISEVGQSGASRTRSHRGELALAVARPLHVRHFAGRPSHVAAHLVGDARRRGAVAASLGVHAAVAGDRRRVADRLWPLSDPAAPPPVAGQQCALVAVETRAVLRRAAACGRRPAAA